MVMSGTTCGLRFPEQLNAGVRKMAANVVAFPRRHFFIRGFAPLAQQNRALEVPELASPLFASRNMIAVSAHFRGRFCSSDIEEQMLAVQARNTSAFCKWTPNSIMSSICAFPAESRDRGHFHRNHHRLQRALRQRPPPVHQDVRAARVCPLAPQRGLEIAKFDEAWHEVSDLISEYGAAQPYDDQCGEDEEDEGT
jgi:tubulin beta